MGKHEVVDSGKNINVYETGLNLETPGQLISTTNWQLQNNPSAILDQEVTVLVMPVRTDDWTLGIGDYHTIVEVLHIIESNLKRAKQSELANNFLTKIREEAEIEILLPEPEEPEEAAEQEAPGEE